MKVERHSNFSRKRGIHVIENRAIRRGSMKSFAACLSIVGFSYFRTFQFLSIVSFSYFTDRGIHVIGNRRIRQAIRRAIRRGSMKSFAACLSIVAFSYFRTFQFLSIVSFSYFTDRGIHVIGNRRIRQAIRRAIRRGSMKSFAACLSIVSISFFPTFQT